MGILVKKRQAGGSIFGDPRYLVLNADIPMQKPAGGNATSSKPASTKASTKSTDLKREGLLPSDIAYYYRKEEEIKKRLTDGYASDPNFETTSAFAQILEDKNHLENVEAPSMKSWSDKFESDSKTYNSESTGAGDEEAIIDNKAIVRDRSTGQYGVISVGDMVKNANRFDLLKGRDVLDLRQNDPTFSGFTEAGRIASKLIGESYGSKSFEVDIKKSVDLAGFTEEDGKYVNRNLGQVLDIENLQYNPSERYDTKSNAGQLQILLGNMLSEDTHMLTYAKNKSIADIKRKVQYGEIKLDENTDVGKLITNGIQSYIVDRLKSAATHSRKEKTDRDKANDATRTIYSNPIKRAKVTLFQSPEMLEVPKSIDKNNDDAHTVISSMPASFIPRGAEYLNTGYGEQNKTASDDNVTRFNRRTIGNNSVIFQMLGNDGELTTYAGTKLSDLTEDKENYLNRAIIPFKNPQLTMMLAPVITNEEGKKIVDFDNEYMKEVATAIENVYDRFEKEGIKEEDVLKNNVDAIQRAQEIAKEELRKQIKEYGSNIPEIRAVFAFKVQYEATGKTEDLPDAGWTPKDKGADLYSIIGGRWFDKPKETFIFAPITDSYWSSTEWKASIPNFDESISLDEYEGSIKGRSLVTKKFNIDKMALNIAFKKRSEKKQHGGKLASSDEIIKLLFK